jgi:hypothetical protein
MEKSIGGSSPSANAILASRPAGPQKKEAEFDATGAPGANLLLAD